MLAEEAVIGKEGTTSEKYANSWAEGHIGLFGVSELPYVFKTYFQLDTNRTNLQGLTTMQTNLQGLITMRPENYPSFLTDVRS